MGETQKRDTEAESCGLLPRAIFGFDGAVHYGLNLHPGGKHVAFPLGNKVAISNIITNEQQFLIGHTFTVSCLRISHSGKYVASGQLNHMGFRAYVILWDFAEMKEIARHDLHKVSCTSVCFTAKDEYVVSIGGVFDGNVIIYDIEMRIPICRSVAVNSTSGVATFVSGLHSKSSIFLASGDRHLRLWTIERDQRKLKVQEVQTGRHQRQYTSIEIDKDDRNIYIGTMTGDVAHVRLAFDNNNMTAVMVGLYGKHCPRKPIGKDCEKYVNGVRELLLTTSKYLLLGTGDGTIELVDFRKENFKNYPNPTWPMFKMIQTARVSGMITSMAEHSEMYYIGTAMNEIYLLDIKTFELHLKVTSCRGCINMLTFPYDMSSVFATAGYESIRIWSIKRLKELLRIMVYNFNCMAVVFSYDGATIMSAWDDGVIRAFTPISGKLIYAIPNAHNKGCSSLALTRDNKKLISAGFEGQIRVWNITPIRQTLIAILKDHSGPVTNLAMNETETTLAAAGIDGCCVLWDIKRLTRMQAIRSNTQFTCVRFSPDGSQLLTAGADGTVAYWMTYNGCLLRELQCANKTPVNSVNFDCDGKYFVIAGADSSVQIWDYEKGIPLRVGVQHSAAVNTCRFSPCGKYIVSASEIGLIIVWDTPKQFWPTNYKERKETKKDYVETKTNSNPCRARVNENIKGLEASRKNKDFLCAECPPIDPKTKPDISM